MRSTFRLRAPWAPLAALGLLAGCGERLVAEPVPLSGLAGRTLQYTLTDVDSLEERESTAGAYRLTLQFVGEGGPCVRLEGDVTATLDGEPMKLERGGVPDTGAGGREVCERPRATYDFDPEQWDKAPAADLGIVLQDGTHTVRLVLGQARAKRRFVREDGTSGTLRRGQSYAYGWRPPTDAPPSVQVRLIHVGTGISSPLTVAQEGHTSRLYLPADTREGAYLLRMNGTTPGRVLTCEGVAGCEGFLLHSEDREVSVVP